MFFFFKNSQMDPNGLFIIILPIKQLETAAQIGAASLGPMTSEAVIDINLDELKDLSIGK